MGASESLGSLVLFGGRNDGGTPMNDLWLFSPSTVGWSRVIPAVGDLPQPRFSFNAGVVGDTLYIFGGELQNKDRLNDVWSANLSTGVWTLHTPLTDMVPQARYGAAGGTVSIPDPTTNISEVFLIVSHGFDTERFDDSFVFSFSTSAWTQVSIDSDIPFARCLVSSSTAITENTVTLAMMGGCGSGGYGPCPSSQLYTLSIPNVGSQVGLTGSWVLESESCLNARNYGVMTTVNQSIFVQYGGAGGVLVKQDQVGQVNILNGNSVSQRIYPQGGEQPTGTSSASSMAYLQGLLWLLPGTDGAELYSLDLASPFTLGSCNSDPIPAWRTAHGVLMALSWGFLLPIGVFIARFGRHWNPRWFKLHRGFQMFGVLLMTFGFVIAILMVSTAKFGTIHAYIGIIVTFFGLSQILNGLFRPHVTADDGPKSKQRIIWEYFHKYCGRLALVLGLINPFWGIIYLSGSSSAGFIVYSVWFSLYVVAWTILTMSGLPERSYSSSVIQKKIGCFVPKLNDSFERNKDGDHIEMS